LPAGLEAKTFAITVEPEAGSAAPTSQPIIAGTRGASNSDRIVRVVKRCRLTHIAPRATDQVMLPALPADSWPLPPRK
jgi:hypothetical protein